MNYRHIYHAGNICDVVKHAVYALLIEAMKQKDKGFAVLDTHAGCGCYDLNDERAQKTKEYEEGIARLWATHKKQSENLKSYMDVLMALNDDGDLRTYPGSPLIASRLLREQDRLIACELHPEDVDSLRRVMRRERGVHIHHRDGYGAIKAFLPFPEKRGLLLIDPPFETTDEIDQLIKAACLAHERMKGAVIAIWYPIKERPAVWRLHEGLRDAGLPDMLVAEFVFRPEVRHDRLNGSGLVIVNAPWKMEEALGRLLPELHKKLGTEIQGVTVKTL